MNVQRYEVVGACASATTRAADGKLQRQLFYKGSLLPEDVPAQEIWHLLSVNLIAPVLPAGAPEPPEVVAPSVAGGPVPSAGGEAPTAGADPEGTGGVPAADRDVEVARSEARAKLEAAGGKPTGRHGAPVWAEYLVTKGYDWNLVSKESKEELQRIAEGLPDQ